MSGRAVSTAPVEARRRAGAGELAVVALAGLLPVVASPQVYAYFWAPKVALLLPAIVPGLVALAVACRARDAAAWAAAAFCAVAAIAALFAPAPGLAFLGLHNLGSGWWFVAACVGLWALGRGLGEDARRLLMAVLLSAAALEAAVAWAQSVWPLGTDLLEPFEGRAGALLGNPVHVAAFLVAALALGLPRLAAAHERSGRATLAWLFGAALLAGAVQLSGGRTGLGLLVLVVVWAGLRFGLRIAALFLVAVVVGAGFAGLVTREGTISASDRIARDSTAGWGGRVDRWATALPAIGERPLLGYGPGQFRRATSPHATAASARAFGADTLSEDAHDLVVEYAVTTGLLGVAALLAWLVLSGRRARGPLAAFAVFGGLALMVQPQTVGLTPVLVLALGAAAPRVVAVPGRAGRVVALAGLLGGVFVAVLFLRGELLLGRAATDGSVADARAATEALPAWPVGPHVEARALAFEGISQRDPEAQRAAIEAQRAAVARDPSDPRAWNDLAGLELNWGSTAAARDALRAARRWNPWSVRAMRAQAQLAAEAGDRARAERLCARMREVSPRTSCPTAEG